MQRIAVLLAILAVLPQACDAGAFFSGAHKVHVHAPSEPQKKLRGVNDHEVPGTEAVNQFLVSSVEAKVKDIASSNSTGKAISVADAKILSSAESISLMLKTDTADPAAIMNMEDSLTNLFRGSHNLDKQKAQDLAESVQQILDLIANTMMPKVEESHRANQKEIDRLRAAMNQCPIDMATGFAAAQPFNKTYLTSSPLHKQCRFEEAINKTAVEMCTVVEESALKNFTIDCQLKQTNLDEWGTPAIHHGIITPKDRETPRMFIERLAGTYCGEGQPDGKNIWIKYLALEKQCNVSNATYILRKAECDHQRQLYALKMASCNNIQKVMDGGACSNAVQVKDTCEDYARCYKTTVTDYNTTAKAVKLEEADRKIEWGALKRMHCLIGKFTDPPGTADCTNEEIAFCKGQVHSTAHLDIAYPPVPKQLDCTVPSKYPATAAYKIAEFGANLPAKAQGQVDSHECYGVMEIATNPKEGSPRTCKCKRITMNGPYSPGAMVACENCLDVYRSSDKDSCPDGTKLFSPRSRIDWKSFIDSAPPLRAPSWIVDITSPQNSIGQAGTFPMNSDQTQQSVWVTQDASPWFLRADTYTDGTEYTANCYFDLISKCPGDTAPPCLDAAGAPTPAPAFTQDTVAFKAETTAGGCTHHSTSYYCQPKKISTTPKTGSPAGCNCNLVSLTAKYSPGMLLKCMGCLDVYRSNDKNSCPEGTKLFSPRSQEDWVTFLASAGPLRSPNWIVDITRSSDGCGDAASACANAPMNFENPDQVGAGWTTSDKSPWWLRSTKYSQPNGDGKANCYMDLWGTPNSPNDVTFDDAGGTNQPNGCKYHSDSYYCQPTLASVTHF